MFEVARQSLSECNGRSLFDFIEFSTKKINSTAKTVIWIRFQPLYHKSRLIQTDTNIYGGVKQ